MKYILGMLCLIISCCFYIKPDLMTEKNNIIFGIIFMLLANLFIKKRDDE